MATRLRASRSLAVAARGLFWADEEMVAKAIRLEAAGFKSAGPHPEHQYAKAAGHVAEHCSFLPLYRH